MKGRRRIAVALHNRVTENVQDGVFRQSMRKASYNNPTRKFNLCLYYITLQYPYLYASFSISFHYVSTVIHMYHYVVHAN